LRRKRSPSLPSIVERRQALALEGATAVALVAHGDHPAGAALHSASTIATLSAISPAVSLVRSALARYRSSTCAAIDAHRAGSPPTAPVPVPLPVPGPGPVVVERPLQPQDGEQHEHHGDLLHAANLPSGPRGRAIHAGA
jgi:hypothetical protein